MMVALPDLVIAFSPQAKGSLPKPIAAQQDSREAKHAAAIQEYTVLIDRLKAKGLLVTARKASEGHGGEEGKVWVLVRAEEKLVNELKVKERYVLFIPLAWCCLAALLPQRTFLADYPLLLHFFIGVWAGLKTFCTASPLLRLRLGQRPSLQPAFDWFTTS